MKKRHIFVLILFLPFLSKLGAQSCSAPTTNPTVQIAHITDSASKGIITAATPSSDGYLVVRRLIANNYDTSWPNSGVTYSAGQTALGGEIVSVGSSLTFSDSGLSKLTSYYYFIYPYYDCGDGTIAYYTNVPAHPIQTKNDPCIDEDFEGVEYDDDNDDDHCDYIDPPEDWIISRKSCIQDIGGLGDPDSNHTIMYGASDYIVSPLILNPLVLEFWARANTIPTLGAFITVQYSTTGLSWTNLPFYSVTGSSDGAIFGEWTQYSIDFTLLNASLGLAEGDYYIKWIFNGNPFEYFMDDIKVFCAGSDIDCPPQASWTQIDPTDDTTLNWWETDEDRNLIVPYQLFPPTINISTTIISDYDTATYGDFETCSLKINSGATLNINTSTENNDPVYHYVAILKQLDVEGTLLVQDKNSLIMVQNEGEVINNGVTNIMKVAHPTKQYDYTYWSSPVANASFSSFTGSDSNYIFKYITQNFLDLYDNNTGLGVSGDPDGLDDDEPWFANWAWNPEYDWQRPTETTMIPGEGYIVEAPSGGSETGQQVTFSGAVNNGKITNDIYLSLNEQSQDPLVYLDDNDDWNLIGNPYPSAIDAAAFLGNPANIELIGGTAYLWTHTVAISKSNIGYAGFANFAEGDYAYFNRSGEVLTFPNQGQDILGKIASGQSFMVEAITTGTAGSKVGEVTFINSMRYDVKESDTKVYPANDNTIFYKQVNTKNKSRTTEAERDRIWLNLTEDEGAFSQLLLGFFEYSQSDHEHATDGIDRAYDGLRLISGNYVDIYTLINNKRFAIQGRTSLKNEDVIPIGFVSNIIGTLKISIGKIEGSLADREVYLEDKLVHTEGNYHNLSEADYEFTVTESGEFNDRFNLKFSKVEETENIVELDEENSIELSKEGIAVLNFNDAVYIRSLNDLNIKKVMVYDMLGRQLVNKTFNSTGLVLRSPNLNKGTILIFKVTMENEVTYTKKFIKF